MNIFTSHTLHHEQLDIKSLISFQEDNVGKWCPLALPAGVTQVTTPTSAKSVGEHSSRSRLLCLASLGGCGNCKELEKLLQTERNA